MNFHQAKMSINQFIVVNHLKSASCKQALCLVKTIHNENLIIENILSRDLKV